MRTRARWAIGVVASLVAHSAAVFGVVQLADQRDARSPLVPMDLVEAPPAPPPPELPPPTPQPVAPPKRKRVKPKPKVVTEVKPPEAKSEVELPPDGGVADAGVTPLDAGEADAGPPAVASGEADAGVLDPGVIDLRPFVPKGERVMVVLRTDRIRGTPWAPLVEAVIAPMPDHRLLLEGTGLGIVDSFDVVVIASPAPRDVTQTFVAARSSLDEAALRRALARPLPGATAPRLAWGENGAERLDPRVAQMNDPRLLKLPAKDWFMLVRPENLAGDEPWLEAMLRVEDQTGAGPTLAVITVADLGTPTLALPLPGLPPLPAPDRLTTAITRDDHGLIITGAALFADDKSAQSFVDTLEEARRQALGSIAARLLLRSVRADGAVRRFSLARTGSAVTFSTSVANQEGQVILDQAAAMARQFFLGRAERP